VEVDGAYLNKQPWRQETSKHINGVRREKMENEREKLNED